MSVLDRLKPRTGHSLLGLALGHDRFEAVELRRSNGSAAVRLAAQAALELDPFAGDPEAAGKALRKHLDAAGIRESRCAVVLPPDLVLGLTVSVPDLPDADRAEFLQIEAERGFPQNPEDLIVQVSLSESAPGSRFATLLAVPRTVVDRVERVLKAARLQSVRITLGLPALQPPGSAESEGVLALIPTGRSLALQLTHAGAIAALRVVDEAFSGDAEPLTFDPDQVLREIRITRGHLPPGAGDSLRKVRVFGQTQASRAVAEGLQPRLQALGLIVEQAADLPASSLPFQLPPGTPASPALAVAVASLGGPPLDFEFLPPRVSAWQQFSQRYSSRRLAWAGSAAGAVAALVCITFLVQQTLLWRWQSRWDAIKARVAKLEVMQKEIRLYRPWYDDSFRSLAILRRLTESFPEDGSVSAKVIEIRSTGRVTCSGTARDPASWLRMRDQLSNAKGIADVQVEQVRGKSPIEFTLNFRWEGPGGS